jgi:hypothetical protein
MGSIPLGYALTSYGQVSHLLHLSYDFTSSHEYEVVMAFVDNIFPLTAIFSISAFT